MDQKKLLVPTRPCVTPIRACWPLVSRTRDMVKGASATAKILSDCFSLEMWGGATFDVAYRFLHESP